MNHPEARKELVALAASLFERGFSVGSAGNISVRVADGYLVTPTNASLGRLVPERLSHLDHNWELLDGDRPTKEVAMHRAMYAARPDAGAVVHLHSTHVTALSCLNPADSPLGKPLTPYFVMRLGASVPSVPYFRPGDADMEGAIREAAEQGSAVILSNHGSVVSAPTLTGAVNAAEELEVSAELALLLHGRPTRPLTEVQVAELLER